MVRKLLRVALVGLLLTMLAAGCSQGTKSPAGPADTGEKPVPVAVVTVREGNYLESINLTGKVVPAAEVAVVTQSAGQVKAVPVTVGQRVSAGDQLVRLDSSELVAQIEKAEAGLTAARNQLQQLQQLPAVSQPGLPAGMPGLEGAADLAAQAAAAQAKQAEAAGALEAQIKQGEAALTAAREQLERMTVRAPVDGVVAALLVDPGEMVAPGMPAALLLDMGVPLVEISVFESEITRFRTGQAVTVELTALPGTLFSGEVAVISPVSDPRTRAFPVRIKLKGKDNRIMAGLFASVTVPVADYVGVLTVPREAVLDRADTKVVYLIKSDRAVEQPVEVRASNGQVAVISQGIASGDLVVVSGQHYLQDGMAVLVQDRGEGQ